MNKKVMLVVALLLVLAPDAYALQQTSGELHINATIGSWGSAKYGLKNEENATIVVKLSASGEAANYLEFPKELTLEPGKLTYVEINASIPKNYTGAKQLNGTVYALMEGEKGGQVQLNVRLGKNVKLTITEPEAKPTPFVGTVMSAIAILAGALIYKKKRR